MVKKNKDEAPNPNNVPNRDVIQRLNFLYQASSYLNGLGLGATHSSSGPPNFAENENNQTMNKRNLRRQCESKKNDNTQKRTGQRKATTHDLARSYVKSMRIIGQKTNVKMDPSIKRTLCKGCSTLLMPGVTAKVRVKPLPSHGHAVTYMCTNCSLSRRIPAPPALKDEEPAQPSSQAIEKSTEPTPGMEIDAVDAPLGVVKEEAADSTKKTSGKQLRQMNRSRKKSVKPRPLPFFERPDHILFIGNERVNRTFDGNELH